KETSPSPVTGAPVPPGGAPFFYAGPAEVRCFSHLLSFSTWAPADLFCFWCLPGGQGQGNRELSQMGKLEDRAAQGFDFENLPRGVTFVTPADRRGVQF